MSLALPLYVPLIWAARRLPSSHGQTDTAALSPCLSSGTGSARAALLNEEGDILAESTYATTTYRSDRDARIFEQSTTEIWKSITSAIKDVVREASIKPEEVLGLGFDATCSLAVCDWDGEPMSVTPAPEGKWGKGERNVVLWADHRAEEEAAEINATGSMVLNYVGKTMSVSCSLFNSVSSG